MRVLLVPGRKHAPALLSQSLVLRQGEGNGLAAVGGAALARELPEVALGLDALEPPRGLVHARVQLEQDVPLQTQLLLATTGHTLSAQA